MKRILIVSLVISILSIAFAGAQNVIDQHFQQYQQDNFTNIHVTSKMFELASYVELEDDSDDMQEMLEFVRTINTFDMIVGHEMDNSQTDYDRAIRTVSREFEELMRVNDEDGNFTFFIDETKGVVHELVMVGMAPKVFLIFSLTGNMDLSQLSKMSKWIQTKEFDQMKKLSEHKVGEVKVYPNPAKINTQLNLEIPDEMKGGTATLYNVNGAVIRRIDLNDVKLGLRTNDLNSGLHILELNKNGVTIKKKLMLH
ncbi:MAG: DUF4252 domain-containing protein [Bacteroidota bacterium]